MLPKLRRAHFLRQLNRPGDCGTVSGPHNQPPREVAAIPCIARPVFTIAKLTGRERPAVIKAIAKRKVVKAPARAPAPITPPGCTRFGVVTRDIGDRLLGVSSESDLD